MYAGGTDVDAGVLVLTGGTDEGIGDFLGQPTGLFFMVEHSIGAYMCTFSKTWAIGRHSF